MAPKKTKKPSMMQRQRQLSAQQQQVKRASSSKLPPGKKGGAVTKPKPTKPTATSKPSPVQQVRVRDLGPTPPKQLSGASQRALPPGTKGGSLARGGAAKAGSLAAKAGGAGRVLGCGQIHPYQYSSGHAENENAKCARSRCQGQTYHYPQGVDCVASRRVLD